MNTRYIVINVFILDEYKQTIFFIKWSLEKGLMQSFPGSPKLTHSECSPSNGKAASGKESRKITNNYFKLQAISDCLHTYIVPC